ncbi:hypothetical protein PCE1_004481 [Barthelona sp. PCE]
MPRVRKFEDDLIIKAYPEGQMIFEGKGLRLLKSRENSDISLIESAVEGKDFVGYVGDTREPLKYTTKLRAGESYMIIDILCENNIVTHLDILLFDHIMSDVHTRRRICIRRSKISRIIPMDENHLLFTIEEYVNFRRVRQCYIFNVITEEYRCLGEYSSQSIINSNYILLRKCKDDTTWQYNFSADDMDEAHEPDVEQLLGIHSKFIIRCYNSDCFGSILGDHRYGELVIFDSQRNQVNLTERFPQLKGLNIDIDSNFALLTLTQDVLSMVFIESSFTMVVHIENGELKMLESEMNFNNVVCDGLKHINLNDNSFRDEDCVFYGVDEITGRYGPIKFRAVDDEVVCLNSLHPKRIFFDGTAEVYDYNSLIRCYFLFKKRKIIVLHGLWKQFSRTRCSILSVPNEDDFIVFAEVRSETGATYVKLRWNDSESEPITTILPHCGSKHLGFIQGLPLNVEYREDGTTLVHLGNNVILDLPPNISVSSAHGSHIDNSACILCSNAIHFFRFNVNGYVVDVQKHIVSEHGYDIDVHFNPRTLAETPDHQLFIECVYWEDGGTQHLRCLDWSTGSFLEPVLLNEYWLDYDPYGGNLFRDFLGDSCIHLRDGIIKVYIEDGAIKTHFYTNDNLHIMNMQNMPNNVVHDMSYKEETEKMSRNLNLPNNTVQEMSYEKETKTMVLKTYNVEEDPESMNPTVETFHLPSFLAEASIVEYQMPDYYEGYHNE